MNNSEGDVSAGISLKVGSPAGSVMSNGGCDLRCTPPVEISAKRHWMISLSNWVQGESLNSMNFDFWAHLLKRGGYLSNNFAMSLSFFCLMPIYFSFFQLNDGATLSESPNLKVNIFWSIFILISKRIFGCFRLLNSWKRRWARCVPCGWIKKARRTY